MTKTYESSDEVAICGEFTTLVGRVTLLTSALSYIIIALNAVLRIVCIKMVDWIGYPTETERLSWTTNVTFYV